MNKKVVAKAVRLEHEPKKDIVYLVFEIVDEEFKKRIKRDWLEDIDLKIIGKDLIEDE